MGRLKRFSREDLLDKVIQIFWEKGFSDTSLQDIEKATGINKSSLYSEFKDKDEIFMECLKRYSKTVGILEILNKEPLGMKNIEKFLLASNETNGQRGCFFANSIREVSILPDKAKPLMQKEISLVKEAVLKNLIAMNLNRDLDAAATMIMTFRSGICLSMNLGVDKLLKSQVKDFLNLLLSS